MVPGLYLIVYLNAAQAFKMFLEDGDDDIRIATVLGSYLHNIVCW